MEKQRVSRQDADELRELGKKLVALVEGAGTEEDAEEEAGLIIG